MSDVIPVPLSVLKEVIARLRHNEDCDLFVADGKCDCGIHELRGTLREIVEEGAP